MPRCLRRPAPLVPPGPAASWPREAAPTGPAIRPPQARGLPGPPSRAAAAILSSLLLSLPPSPRPARTHTLRRRGRAHRPARCCVSLSLHGAVSFRRGKGRALSAAATPPQPATRARKGRRGTRPPPAPPPPRLGRREAVRREERGEKNSPQAPPPPPRRRDPRRRLAPRRWVSGGAGASCARLKGRSAHALPARPAAGWEGGARGGGYRRPEGRS